MRDVNCETVHFRPPWSILSGVHGLSEHRVAEGGKQVINGDFAVLDEPDIGLILDDLHHD